MKGLLLKDIYTLGKQMKLFLVLILVFAVMPGHSMSAFSIMYAAMLPMSTLAYDERAKWDTLASMMPYSTTDIVFSKYLLGYLAVGCATLFSFIVQITFSLLRQAPIESEGIISSLIVAVFATLLQAIDLPMQFKLGAERGRILFIIITVAMTMAIVTFSDTLTNQLFAILNQGSGLFLMVLLCIALTLVLNAASIFLSVKLYKSNFK